MEFGSVSNTSTRVFKPVTKLWIADCLRIAPHPTVENAYSFYGFAVEYVDIFGVVISQKLFRTSNAAYNIDDGTGVITCLYYHKNQKIEDDRKNIVKLSYELASVPGLNKKEHEMLDYMIKPAIKTYENLIEFRKIGETVNVIGRLSNYNDCREIKAYHVNLVPNLNSEVDRLHEMALLYKKGYYKNKVNV